METIPRLADKVRNRRCNITLVEVMIIIAILGLLAAIAVPNFIRAKDKRDNPAQNPHCKTCQCYQK